VLGDVSDGVQTCAMVTFVPNLTNATLDDIDRAKLMENQIDDLSGQLNDDFPVDISKVKN